MGSPGSFPCISQALWSMTLEFRDRKTNSFSLKLGCPFDLLIILAWYSLINLPWNINHQVCGRELLAVTAFLLSACLPTSKTWNRTQALRVKTCKVMMGGWSCRHGPPTIRSVTVTHPRAPCPHLLCLMLLPWKHSASRFPEKESKAWKWIAIKDALPRPRPACLPLAETS